MWDVDTEQPYKTVNGVEAHGGSHGRPGPGDRRRHAVRRTRDMRRAAACRGTCCWRSRWTASNCGSRIDASPLPASAICRPGPSTPASSPAMRLRSIIDTGANAAAAATIHGYASIARPSNDLLVLNTERHFDHIGGNGYFRDLGIDVYGHASIQRTESEFRAEMAEFNAEISNPARRDRAKNRDFLSRDSPGESELRRSLKIRAWIWAIARSIFCSRPATRLATSPFMFRQTACCSAATVW